MTRLRNTTTGVVVNVDAETAARLGAGWESAEKPEPKAESKAEPKGRPTPRRGRAKAEGK